MSKECVSELEGHLRDMLSLKPPGVTKGKVDKITELCNENIKSESILIQRIYTHFKKTPPTHKLGVLYVIDSVMRGWVEQAKKAGQALGQPSPAPGTFAAGASLVTELLGSFMNEMINTAPEEHKARIIKLLDIWDRGETFPREKLAEYRQRLTAPVQNAAQTTTPTGSPPNNNFNALTGGAMAAAAAGAAPAPDTSKILQALADMAKSNAPPGGVLAPTSSGMISDLGNAFQQNMPSSVNSGLPVRPHNGQSVSMPGAVNGANGALNSFGAMSSAPSFAQNIPPPGQAGGVQAGNSMTAEALQQQVQLIQMLQAQGVPQEQWAAVLQVLMSAGAVGQVANNPAAQQWQPPAPAYAANESRDRTSYGDQYGMRTPSSRYRSQRSRSRSPVGRRGDVSPPRRRDSPTYGNFGRDGDRRGGQGRGGDYRRRSPDRYHRNASPSNYQELPPPGPRKLDHDRSLPPNHIRVLSRTLFVGGVTSSESHLRGIFSQFGLVQTCIVNVDKRHAFVKMLTRTDAMSAKHGMENFKSPDMQLRTRWGVGFGPRDCSNYQTGVSVIPLDRLTDADRKWMLTAEYGGTGGQALEGGLVIEEPDIEIGAGVSSKAISRRMQTDKSGQAGPRSSRDPASPGAIGSSSNQLPLGQNNRFRQDSNDQSNSSNGTGSANMAMPPGMPNFQFPFQGMPGMPPGFQFPPGFVFPGQAAPPGTGAPGT